MNITKTPWFLVLGLALGATACGDDDSGTNNATGRDVQAACEAYVGKYCEQMVVPCYSVSQSDCVSESQRTLPGGSCAGADSVGPTYDACMEDLDAMTCDATAMPSSCKNAILIKIPESNRSDAPAACEALVAKICEEWLVPCESMSQPDCVGQVRSGLSGGSCAGADRVAATYDACMADLDTMTCDATAVPTSCNSVILYQ